MCEWRFSWRRKANKRGDGNGVSATECCMPQLLCCVVLAVLMPPPISQALCNWQHQHQPEDEAIISTCNMQQATSTGAGHLDLSGVWSPYSLQTGDSRCLAALQLGGSNTTGRCCHMASALSLRLWHLSSCCCASCRRRCRSRACCDTTIFAHACHVASCKLMTCLPQYRNTSCSRCCRSSRCKV